MPKSILFGVTFLLAIVLGTALYYRFFNVSEGIHTKNKNKNTKDKKKKTPLVRKKTDVKPKCGSDALKGPDGVWRVGSLDGTPCKK